MKNIMKRIQGTAGILILGSTAVMLTATGCSLTRRPPPPPLLGARGTIPAPYLQPGGALPTEPSFQPDIDLPPTEPGGGITLPPTPTGGIDLPPVVEAPTLTYTVRKGDSLWKIARKYKVSFRELAAYNNMDPEDMLIAGKVLTIPPGGQRVEQGTLQTAKNTGSTGSSTVDRQPLPSDRKYTVKAGDSLWVIARRFGVKVNDLKALNNLTSETIHVGAVLVLPAASGTTATESTATGTGSDTGTGTTGVVVETSIIDPNTGTGTTDATPDPANLLEHTIIQGDSLEEIADMYGTTVDAIKRANPDIKSDEDLVVNAAIKVPFE